MADSPNDRRAADRAPVASKRPADPGRRAAPAARARLGSGLVAAGALLLLIVAAVIFDAADNRLTDRSKLALAEPAANMIELDA